MDKIKSNYSYKQGVKDGLPIGLGYLSVSFAFGVQASLLGISPIISILISMTNLTSAGQLAGITVIAEATTFIALVSQMIITQLIINARYALMGIALSQKLDSHYSISKRLISSATITDEIFAVGVSKPSVIGFKYFSGLALLPYLGWVTGTIIGALLGDVLPTEVQSALGIALYAMFLAIIIPPAEKELSVLLVVLLSAGLSCLFYFVPVLAKNVPSGISVIICALVSTIIIALFFPIKDKKDTTENSEVNL